MIGTGSSLSTLPSAQARGAATLAAARRLARRCHTDLPHVEHVARLALSLFDQLADHHGLGDDERRILHVAALLHDIGEVDGPKAHHKRSAELIMAADELPDDPRWRRLVAAAARYHRKALPRFKHPHYGRLDPEDRARVRWIAGLLRLADALDKGRRKLLRDVRCSLEHDALQLHCFATDPRAAAERLGQLRKRDLLSETLGREIRYTLHPAQTPDASPQTKG